MIPEPSLSAFADYSATLPGETIQEEMKTFLSKAVLLPHSTSLETIHAAFKELRTIFSPETYAAVPSLAGHINELERASEQAAHVDSVAQPILRVQPEAQLPDQDAGAALKEDLARLRSSLIAGNFQIESPLPVPLDEQTSYVAWVRRVGDGIDIVNIQRADEFSDRSSKDKLGLSIDGSGSFLSVWENGADTKALILPQKWAPIVRAAATAANGPSS
jgi:hypothetical protein